jgi:hypothetical protein
VYLLAYVATCRVRLAGFVCDEDHKGAIFSDKKHDVSQATRSELTWVRGTATAIHGGKWRGQKGATYGATPPPGDGAEAERFWAQAKKR